MNSPVFKGWESRQDAACVHALRKGGAVIVGKTVTTEFAIGYSGPTTNPFDPQRTPGGSSSGSAAAVGAGMVPVALGTQTGASTLRPASYCGAVGFKSTAGAFHMGGIHPLSATCDHLGVIAGTLEDAWRVASRISLGLGSPGHRFLNGAGAEPPPPAKPRRLVRFYTRGWTEIDSERDETRAMVREVAVGSDGFITLASSGPAIHGLEYTGSRTFPTYGSWLGLPAFSLPLMQANGLPFGLQLMGADGADGALAATAHWFTRELA